MRKPGSDFVTGEMDGDLCVLSEKGPPGGGPPGEVGGGDGGGGPPGGRKKRQVDLPTINIDTFDVDWISFFAVQDKPVFKHEAHLPNTKVTTTRVTQSWTQHSTA